MTLPAHASPDVLKSRLGTGRRLRPNGMQIWSGCVAATKAGKEDRNDASAAKEGQTSPAPAPFSFHRISPSLSLRSLCNALWHAAKLRLTHSLTHSLRYWMKRGGDRERDGSLTESNSIVERILEAMPDQRRRCDVASSLMQNSRDRLCRHHRRSSSGPSPPLRGSASSSCCC